jgi:hypothetical protein
VDGDSIQRNINYWKYSGLSEMNEMVYRVYYTTCDLYTSSFSVVTHFMEQSAS